MKKFQRCATLFLLALFAVLSIGGDGCLDWGLAPTPNATATECCPAGQLFYGCAAQVQITTVQLIGDGTGPADEVRCYAPAPACASNADEARKNILATATAQYTEAMTKIVQVQTVNCSPLSNCQKASTPNPWQAYDYPGGCYLIMEADAGPPPPPTCILSTLGSDPCLLCLATCCTEYTACLPAGVQGECAQMVDYWRGIGPAAAGQASPEAAALDTCFTNAGCNDVSVCGAKAYQHEALP